MQARLNLRRSAMYKLGLMFAGRLHVSTGSFEPSQADYAQACLNIRRSGYVQARLSLQG